MSGCKRWLLLVLAGCAVLMRPALAVDPVSTRSAPESKASGSLVQRHTLADRQWRMFFEEQFDDGAAAGDRGWLTIGEPQVDRVEQDGATGITISPPLDGFHRCRLERSFEREAFRGRDVRLTLRLLHRTQAEVNALRDVELSVMVGIASGERYTLRLPFVAGMSPGWERHQFYLRFGDEVTDVALRLDLARGGAWIAIDQLSLASVRSEPEAAERDVLNAISDGSFETGQPLFFASSRKRWPNGSTRHAMLPWSFDSGGVEGAQCLRVELNDAVGRIGWWPVDVSARDGKAPSSATRWHLRFKARADKPATIITMVTTKTDLVVKREFTLENEWKTYSHEFEVESGTLGDRLERAASEVLFEMAAGDDAGVVKCWVDAVELSNVTMAEAYRSAASAELGIVTDRLWSGDLCQLWQVGEPVSFSVRVAVSEYEPMEKSGTLAVDVVNALGEVIETRVVAVEPQKSGVIALPFTFELPRGYYRVMATLWASDVGASKRLAHMALGLGVIRMDDPVPTRSRFGLTADDLVVSRRTTHLGAGWVMAAVRSDELELDASRRDVERWDGSAWRAFVTACATARVEVVGRVSLPGSVDLCEPFVRGWLRAASNPLLGVYVELPAIAQGVDEVYGMQLAAVRSALGSATGTTVVLERAMIRAGQRLKDGEVIGVACRAGVLPEDQEATLATFAEFVGRAGRMWDVQVPVTVAGRPVEASLDEAATLFDVETGPVQRLAAPSDAGLSASQLVRTMMIRSLAGVELACCSAAALSPVETRTSDAGNSLHEYDLSPKPGLVAFDLMAELLNDATLERWLDVTDGVRLLVFRKGDGRAVLAAWRPFGQSSTRVTLAIPRENVEVMDCLGTLLSQGEDASQTVLAVNEIVQYVICPAADAAVLAEALDTLGADEAR